MSNNALALLDIIKNEYQERLKAGTSENQAIIFNTIDITNKCNINSQIIDDLLEELDSYGYIEKWITGDFSLKVD